MKRFFFIGFLLVLLAAIPLTIYLLQKQQQTKSHAAPSTILSFTPVSSASAPIQKNTGDAVDLHVQMDPGTNLVTYVKLDLIYDATKFSTVGNGFTPNTQAFPAILGTTINTPGELTIELSIGANSTAVIQAPTEVGVLNLKANAPNTPTSPTVSFGAQTLVLSSCPNPQDPASCPDTEAANVLSTSTPVYVAIAGVAISPTPGPTTATTAPVCTSFNADRTPTGTSPFSLALTATGNSTQGTIGKVTFNFGDGPTQDVIAGGGIGTKNASVQVSHTYNNGGVFKASAVLTDNNGTVSDINSCTMTVTVSGPTAAPGGPVFTPGPTATPTPTLKPTLTPTPTPTKIPVAVTPCPDGIIKTPCSGPGDTFVQIGAIGGILSVLGAILFFAL